MATYDEQYLSADQQKQIQAAKKAWDEANAAGDQAGMDAAHAQAESIRNSAGYSGGADGSGYGAADSYGNGMSAYNSASTAPKVGGMSAADTEQWYKDYMNQMYGAGGWDNGYNSTMNTRSIANYIRQQMDANSKAWAGSDADTRNYLHDQNLQLAQLLERATGGAKSTFNNATGRWETTNGNLGYGVDVGQYKDSALNDWYSNFGYAAEDLERYRNDTSRYYNFVDRDQLPEIFDASDGFTGKYRQYVNGPYAALMGGENGINADDSLTQGDPRLGALDDYGAYKKGAGLQEPLLNNQWLDDYTKQFTAYTDNGVIQPGLLQQTHGGLRGEEAAYDNINGYKNSLYGGANGGGGGSAAIARTLGMGLGGSGSFGGLGGSGSIDSMYDAQLKAQLAALEAAYKENVSDLDAAGEKTAGEYAGAMRNTQGTSDLEKAKWNEMANAYGLNSGAIGQAGLARSNQLQSDLGTLRTAQQQNMAELQRQKLILGQKYQAAIVEAQANNDFERAQMLYQEAVRQQEQLMQQMQFQSQMALEYYKLGLQYPQEQASSGRYYSAQPTTSATSFTPVDYGADRDVNIPGLGRISYSQAALMADRGQIVRNGFDENGDPTYTINPRYNGSILANR